VREKRVMEREPIGCEIERERQREESVGERANWV